MLSQFSREHEHHVTLADLDFEFAKDVYPIGRLDADSEGLLLLSNDKSLTDKLLHPNRKVAKTYLAQIEGIPTTDGLQKLKRGVIIKVKKKEHKTLPCEVSLLTEEPNLPERNPPIRFRKFIPTSWVSITIKEGKNRQVRRMFASINNPVLRLVRVSLGTMNIDQRALKNMGVGEVREIKVDL